MGDKLREFVEVKSSRYAAFADAAQKYLSVVESLIIGDNPELYRKITAKIATMREKIVVGPPSIAAYIETFGAIERYDGDAAEVAAVVSNDVYMRRFLYNSSSSGAIATLQDAALAAYNAIKHGAIEDIVHEAIATGEDVVEALGVVKHGNSFVVKLIETAAKGTTGAKKRALTAMIDSIIDVTLGASRVKLEFGGIQGLTSRYGCEIGPVVSESEFTGGQSLAEFVAPDGLVVYNCSAGTALQFDARGLIDAAYIEANGLKTPPLAGLNKKILQRFATVTPIPGGRSDDDTVIVPGTSESWRVFQRLTKTHIRELLDAPAEKMLAGISGRPRRYSEIQEKTIMARCFDPNAPTTAAEYENTKAVKFDSGVVRVAIRDKMVSLFSRSLAGVKNERDLQDAAIKVPEITNILIDTLVTSTGMRARKSPEHIITYLSKFDGITRAFIKELEKRWGKSGITGKVFKEYSGDGLGEYLAGVYAAVVDSALAELDKTGSWSEYDLSVKEYFLDKFYI